jgi:hypothetical protein
LALSQLSACSAHPTRRPKQTSNEPILIYTWSQDGSGGNIYLKRSECLASVKDAREAWELHGVRIIASCQTWGGKEVAAYRPEE